MEGGSWGDAIREPCPEGGEADRERGEDDCECECANRLG